MQQIADLFTSRCPSPWWEEAREQSKEYGSDLTRWWVDTERGDWLLWVAAECGSDLRRIALVACACSELAIPLLQSSRQQEKLRTLLEVAKAGFTGKDEGSPLRIAADEAHDICEQAIRECDLPGARVAGSVEQALFAVAHVTGPHWSVVFAVQALSRAIIGAKEAAGERAMVEMQRRQAQIVRSRLSLDTILAGWRKWQVPE